MIHPFENYVGTNRHSGKRRCQTYNTPFLRRGSKMQNIIVCSFEIKNTKMCSFFFDNSYQKVTSMCIAFILKLNQVYKNKKTIRNKYIINTYVCRKRLI